MHQTNFFVKSMFGENCFFYTKNASKNDLKMAFFKRAVAPQESP